MGSYSHLAIGGFPIEEIKNGYSEEAADCLFHPSDYREETRPNRTRNKLVWGNTFEKDDSTYTFKGFVSTVGICRQPLEIYGATRKRAQKDFVAAKKIAARESLYSFSFRNISYSRYHDAIKKIIDGKIRNYDDYPHTFEDQLASSGLYFLGQSTPDFLYSVLSCFPDEEIVEYDLSHIVDDYIPKGEILRRKIEKIIILTEGKTDTEFISRSLKLLYPHLFHYYNFIDFDEFSVKLESNASALVKLVIAFASANVSHPIVVLFDNDTTGIMEMQKLLAEKLPANIRVLKLPDIRLAKHYPTIGPSGVRKMNVNGLACGIEMYTGADTLTKNNSFIPVLWKGYNDKQKKYQGEIAEKVYVQEQFKQKLNNADLARMEDMTAILEAIFGAFRD